MFSVLNVENLLSSSQNYGIVIRDVWHKPTSFTLIQSSRENGSLTLQQPPLMSGMVLSPAEMQIWEMRVEKNHAPRVCFAVSS